MASVRTAVSSNVTPSAQTSTRAAERDAIFTECVSVEPRELLVGEQDLASCTGVAEETHLGNRPSRVGGSSTIARAFRA